MNEKAAVLDLAVVGQRIREACDIAGEPVYSVEDNGYSITVYGDPGWTLQVGNPHAPHVSPDITLRGRRWFAGSLTVGAWAALRVLDQHLATLPNDQKY